MMVLLDTEQGVSQAALLVRRPGIYTFDPASFVLSISPVDFADLS